MPSSRTRNTVNSNEWKGTAPAADANGLFNPFAWVPKFTTKTADYTVLSTDSGTFFNNVGATAHVNFTLPAISTGPWQFWFVASASAVHLTVTAATADTMITFNDLQADSIAFSTSNEIIGGIFWAFCDGTSLWCIQIGGVSHRQTATVAT